MRRIILHLAVLLALAIILLAQGAAPPAPTELQRLRLLSSYSHALMAQQAAQSATAEFNSARDAYTKLADDIATEMKLPKGSQFTIDIPKQSVAIQVPPPPVADKPSAPTPPVPATIPPEAKPK